MRSLAGLRRDTGTAGGSVARTEVSRELRVGRACAVDCVWRPGELVEDDAGHVGPAQTLGFGECNDRLQLVL